MAYRVTAGRVSAETQVHESGSRATVDFHRGAELPADVPDEQLQALLRLGHVEPVDDEVPEVAPEPPADPPVSDDLAGLDKDALVALADQEGVVIDKRWGADKLAAAIRDSRK